MRALMFFILAKILGFFSMPSNVLMALGVIGVVLMAGPFAQGGRRIAATALILLGVAGWSPFGNAIIRRLQNPAALLLPAKLVEDRV